MCVNQPPNSLMNCYYYSIIINPKIIQINASYHSADRFRVYGHTIAIIWTQYVESIFDQFEKEATNL